MTPELKARWIKALRSGRYKQCKMVTQDGNGHNCCLGVLGRIIHQKNLINNLSTTPLPDKILNWSIQTTLCNQNDNGRSFKEIADYIEHYVN